MNGHSLAIAATSLLALAAASRQLSRAGSKAPEAQGDAAPISLRNMASPYKVEEYARRGNKIEEELKKLKGKILDAEASSRWDRHKYVRGKFPFSYINADLVSIPSWVTSFLSDFDISEDVREYVDWEMDALFDALDDQENPLYQEWRRHGEGFEIERGILYLPHDLGAWLDDAEEKEDREISIRRSIAGFTLVQDDSAKALFDDMNHILMCLQQREKLERHLKEEMKGKLAVEEDWWWEERLQANGWSPEEIEQAKRGDR